VLKSDGISVIDLTTTTTTTIIIIIIINLFLKKNAEL
jgi:hypothetical protein